ncbi:MAG: endonuclease/exonuclease/phosphatase family protein [Aureliella sp.]
MICCLTKIASIYFSWIFACTVITGATAFAEDWIPAKSNGTIRVATFNVSLNRPEDGKLAKDLQAGDAQAMAVAAVIRAVQPDVLLLNELDYDSTGDNASLFASRYLAATARDSLGGAAWSLPFVYSAPVNTGVPSGLDLNQNGSSTDPDDAWGYGKFPGQYGMAVLSRFPIDDNNVRRFQNMRWSSMPNALAPMLSDGSPYYPADVWKSLRLSSKSFWDVPVRVRIAGKEVTLHALTSHPTPPAFDGPEDRNGCRNHDEIRLVIDYLENREYLVDDDGKRGGLAKDQSFVVLGDLNSDPNDGGSQTDAIRDLLAHQRVARAPAPSSMGAARASKLQGGANAKHRGPANEDTGDFSDRAVGNLRIDYALPSADWKVVQSGVFWPDLTEVSETDRRAIQKCLEASDHHLVWIDLQLASESNL